ASGASDILRRLQEDADAGYRVEFGSEAGNDAVRRNVPLGSWLESQIDACTRTPSARAEPATADGARDALYRRILLDDGRDFLQFALHQLKRGVGVAADASEDGSGVLLREEPSRNHEIQVDVQTHRCGQKQHHRAPMIECPAEGPLVTVTQALEAALEGGGQSRRLALDISPEKPRTHHWSRRQ